MKRGDFKESEKHTHTHSLNWCAGTKFIHPQGAFLNNNQATSREHNLPE